MPVHSICLCVLSRFSCVWFFATLWTVACQAPVSMGFPGKNTGVSCHVLLGGIFLNQGLNPHLLRLLHCRQILYHWATREASDSFPSQSIHFWEAIWHSCSPLKGKCVLCHHPNSHELPKLLSSHSPLVTLLPLILNLIFLDYFLSLKLQLPFLVVQFLIFCSSLYHKSLRVSFMQLSLKSKFLVQVDEVLCIYIFLLKMLSLSTLQILASSLRFRSSWKHQLLYGALASSWETLKEF